MVRGNVYIDSSIPASGLQVPVELKWNDLVLKGFLCLVFITKMRNRLGVNKASKLVFVMN